MTKTKTWILFGLTAIFLIMAPTLSTAQNAESTEEATSEATAEATAETTPEATSEATPEATPEVDEAECPALVERALRLTREGCEDAANNEICYGHLLLDSVLRSGSDPSLFDDPGESIDVNSIQNLSLSALDTNRGVWGVVLLQIAAALNLDADTNDVTYVVFGDAELEAARQLIPVTFLEDSNIRAEPATTAEILTSMDEGETIIASGQTEDGEWLRIRLRDAEDETIINTGWVATELVSAELELSDLPVVSPEDVDELERESSLIDYGPMQAFYFSSGIDDAPCSAAPNSGMLIQTPEGTSSISLWIDEVVIELNATAFVQAEPNGDISIKVLEGSALVTANGETRTAIAGTEVNVALDENLGAVDVPQDPQPYALEDLQALPTTLLDESVNIAAPLDLGPGVPAPGSWSFRWGVEALSCPDGSTVTFESSGAAGQIGVIGNGEAIIWGGLEYSRISDGVYTTSFIDANGNLHQDTLTVSALDRISGQKTVDYAATVCTLDIPFSLTLVGVGG